MSLDYFSVLPRIIIDYTYTIVVLQVKCAHTLYRRTKVSSMSYADVAEVAFANGPQWSRKFSLITRQSVLWLLFVTYFGTCSVYTVIIASNFEQLFTHHMGYKLDLRLFIAMLLIPLILLSYVPNLKYLAPVSMVANLLMATGLGITFYYTLCDVPKILERPAVGTFETFPTFFCLTVFAMEAIGVVRLSSGAIRNWFWGGMIILCYKLRLYFRQDRLIDNVCYRMLHSQ